MDTIGWALILIFCTPLGWIGLLVFSLSVSLVIDTVRS